MHHPQEHPLQEHREILHQMVQTQRSPEEEIHGNLGA